MLPTRSMNSWAVCNKPTRVVAATAFLVFGAGHARAQDTLDPEVDKSFAH